MNKYIKIIQCEGREGHKCDECGCDKKVAMVKVKKDTQIDKGYMCLKCIGEMFLEFSKEVKQ